MKLRWLPNLITTLRMVGTLALLFLVPASREFYFVYTFTGMTDVLDGALARALKITSPVGARLDSIADLLFYSVMLLRLLPMLWQQLPGWIWLWVGLILVLRLSSYMAAYQKTGEFAALHTILNKATGFGVLMVPFFLGTPGLFLWSVAVCILATLSSGQELYFHCTRKDMRRENYGKKII